MSAGLLGVALVVGLFLASWGLYARWRHEVAVRRLQAGPEMPLVAPEPELVGPPTPVLREWPWVPWVALAGSALALRAAGLPWSFACTLGALLGVLAWLLLAWLHDRAATRLEGQLADALDLMVGALRAGSGLLDALEVAAREVRSPLRGLFEQTVDRIRLGDDPPAVFLELPERAPLEPFSLFATTLAVHWETGGSLASTLVGVSATIRDRNELSRRVRAQATQARASVIGILGIVWLLGLGGLFADPGRLRPFLDSSAGELLTAATIGLQALGLVWIAALSRVQP